MTDKPFPRRLAATLTGRAFVHPVFDYLIIGGGLSLIVTAVVMLSQRGSLLELVPLPYFILFANSAHFASSTVRLYTKPGTYEALPFLTLMFPLVTLAVLTAFLLFAGSAGPHFQALYLTWSPYHYAAQAYGLAVMYGYRSGCQIADTDKRLLYWTSMLPFFYAFLYDGQSGVHWLLPSSVLQNPSFHTPHAYLILVLRYGSIAAALLLFVKVARGASGALPIISVMMLIANAAWWCFLPQDAFAWATIFHGLQYLAIVTIFHVKDQLARPDNKRGWLFHVASFYGMSVILGYGLFSCMPWGFAMLGFGMVESIALCIAAINIHHFIVDAYIWRLKKGDGNRAIVESSPAPTMSTAPA